jgi:hypothetical protein
MFHRNTIDVLQKIINDLVDVGPPSRTCISKDTEGPLAMVKERRE